MTLRRQIVRGTAWVALGEGVGYAASFVRNMILARILSKADFGMAVVFGMVMSLLELIAKLSVGRFLVQDKDGDEAAFVATGHALQGIAAAGSAFLILALAPALATWFGIREHTWALMTLATVVLVRGLEHLDVRRFERHLRFGPSAAVEAVPQVIVTLAAWPVAQWLGDFRAVLVLLLVKNAMSCALSHLWAERPYRWQWHPLYVVRMLRFGWPLVLTGFLMFGIMQGDQFLVGTYYTLSDLAPYGAAVALVMAPQFLVGRIFNTVALPLMARAQDEPELFIRRYRQVLGMMSVYAAVSSAGFLSGAEALMRVAYGPQYAGAGVLMAWLATAAAFRSLRMAVAVANLARGDSQSQLWANVFRASSLGPAFLMASTGRPLWMLAACGVIGEILATSVCIWRLWKRHSVPPGVTVAPMLWILAVIVNCGMFGYWLSDMPVLVSVCVAFAAAVGWGAAVAWSFGEFRSEWRRYFRDYRIHGFKGAYRSVIGEVVFSSKCVSTIDKQPRSQGIQ